MKLVNDTVERFRKQKFINEKVTGGLKRNDPKTSKFYFQRYIKKVPWLPSGKLSELSYDKYFKICRLPPSTYS